MSFTLSHGELPPAPAPGTGAGTAPAAGERASGASALGTLEFQHFKRRLLAIAGFDLEQYKGEQMERRTRQWMQRMGIPTMAALARQLGQDASLRREFLDYLTINTSQFFRDPSTFEALRRRVLPGLLHATGRLRIWSAGCSIGAEPYTIAIILDEMGQGAGHYLLGTDIDDDALERARAGEYHDLHLTTVPVETKSRYFRPTGPGRWSLDPAIRERVWFRHHDLLRDPLPAGFHLVLCRHLLIYLTQPSQAALIRRLAGSLMPGGFLVVGGPEQIALPAEYGLERVEHSIYRRKPADAPPAPGPSSARP
ncbi:MAG: protein-glutamate O-methyltransferase CheR [Limnochordaceae bacterium]|nr:protein-glutamate O-methyltransferase CheR [Limnochordaceae bacterium]